jgi:hypothetical protein
MTLRKALERYVAHARKASGSAGRVSRGPRGNAAVDTTAAPASCARLRQVELNHTAANPLRLFIAYYVETGGAD